MVTDLLVKNIQQRFEELIDSLSIKAEMEKYLENQVNYIKKQLMKVSERTIDYPETSIQRISNNIKVIRFWYGNSWDRGVHINQEFDIEIYVIYRQIEEFNFQFNENTIEGGLLFTVLFDDLKKVQNEISSDLTIVEENQYSHAITIKLEYQDKILKIDTIPAIELPDQYLIVPDGLKDCKKMSLILEEDALLRLDIKNQGNGTKLIRLIKYWNRYWDMPLKSYIIQRLVEDVFLESEINDWEKAVKKFFQGALNIINKYDTGELVLVDRIYNRTPILEDFIEDEIRRFHDALQKANKYALKDKWNKLFGKF